MDRETATNGADTTPGAAEEFDAIAAFEALDADDDESDDQDVDRTVDQEDETPEDQSDEDQDEDENEDDGEDLDDEPDPDEDDDEDEDEAEDDDDEEEIKFAADDQIVQIKSGDEEFEVPVSDLKRLFGQEAKITRQSQQVKQELKTLGQASEQHATAILQLRKRAAERLEPFSKMDFVQLARDLEPEAYEQISKDAQAAFDDFKFLNEELDGLTKDVKERNEKSQREAAKKAYGELQDLVPGWNGDLYNNLREYAVDNGLDKDVVNQLIDPATWALMNKAYLYDQARKTGYKKRKKTTRGKTLKTTKAPKGKNAKTANKKAAMDRLKKTGNAVDAFMALDD